jgi:hypothetical protein
MAWGDDLYAQTALPAFAFPVLSASAGGDHSLALLADGSVVGWGGNYSGQSTVPEAAFGVKVLSAGGAHSLALVSEHESPVRLEIAPGPSQVGGCRLVASGLLGRGPVVIYGSTDAVNWQPIFTNPPTLGRIRYLDLPISASESRFYRVREKR